MENVQALLGFKEDIRGIFGNELVSVVLYGSIASGDFLDHNSDINVIIIVKQYDFDALHRMSLLQRRWGRARIAPPLLFTVEEIQASLDVFPMEFLDIRENSQLLDGVNILSRMPVPKKYLRLQCEHELRSKFILLKRSFLEAGGNTAVLRSLLVSSFNTFVVIVKNILRLENKAVPAKKSDIIQTAVEQINLNPYSFQQILKIKQKEIKPNRVMVQEIFTAYINEVQNLIRLVDKWNKREKK